MPGRAGSGAATARWLFGVAQIVNGLERRIGTDEMQHLILFR
jgi:hypothetical protein